jgi:hypothetical protein
MAAFKSPQARRPNRSAVHSTPVAQRSMSCARGSREYLRMSGTTISMVSCYVMVVLDLAAVSDIRANKGSLDAKLRDYVRANAAKAFDDLEKEEAKRDQ